MLNTKTFFLKKSKILLSLFFIFTLSSCNGLFSDEYWDLDSSCDDDDTDVDFKQVGYWIKSDINDFEDIADSDYDIDYSQMTHLIFGSIAVNADGSFDVDSSGELNDIDDNDDLIEIIEDIQNDDVEVFFSIGGDGNSSNLETIAGDDDLIDDFIDNINDLIDAYGLDGIDLSWQWPEDDSQGELLENLAEALYDEGITFSIEVVSGLDDEEDLADVITSDTFDYVDFVNVKAFNTNNDDDENDDDDMYLTTDDFLDVIDYWTDRCLIQNKLVVGIPVYGTAGANADDTIKTYSEIVDSKTNKSTYACDTDDKVSISGDYYYFNAIPTVVEKTAYAVTYAGGVMLNTLAQDYNDGEDDDGNNYSLLNAIYDEVEENDNVCD